MVEQTQPNGMRLTPARAFRSEPPDGGAASSASRHRLLLLVIVLLMVPGFFAVAGTVLTPYRVLLLGIVPVLFWRWINGGAGRPNAVDLLVFASTIWMGLTLVLHHGTGMVPRAALQFLEPFGGYLIGRMLIQDQHDFERFVRYFFLAFLVLVPFQVVQMLTGINVIQMLFDPFFRMPGENPLGRRLGLIRARGPFEHPIAFGLIASLGVANAFYVFRMSGRQALMRTGFVVFTVFTSVSAGPLLSVLVQMFLIAWDRLLAFLGSVKWMLLVYIIIIGFLLLRIAAQFSFLDFVFENLIFSQASAYGRLVDIIWGLKSVVAHPFFGVGQSGFDRPAGNASTLDNYWLSVAIRHGLPALIFLALAGGVTFARIAGRTSLSREAAEYRKGYLFALLGVAIVIFTVNIWNAPSVFVFMYLGAGAWFYMADRPESAREATTRARRAAQARAFATPPPRGGGAINRESIR
jgi:hypothetical protein